MFNREYTKKIILIFAFSFFALITANIVPKLFTLSMSTWFYAFITITLAAATVIAIKLWKTSGDNIGVSKIFSFPSFENFSIKGMLFLLPLIIISGYGIFLLAFRFSTYTIIGWIILFGAMLLFFILGLIKPELGPVSFLFLFSFLFFAEARLYAYWSYLGEQIIGISNWLKDSLFALFNIDVVILAFGVGYTTSIIALKRRLPRTMLDIPIILFLIWTAISVITAQEPVEGTRAFIVKWLLPVFLYYATVLATKRTNGIRQITLAFIFLLFTASLLTIQHSMLENEILQNLGSERAKIWAVICGQVSPWVVLIIPLIISIITKKGEKIPIRFFAGLTLMLVIAMIIWEMNRAALLSLTFMAILWLILYRRKSLRILVFYLIIGMVIFIYRESILSLIKLLRPSLIETNQFSYYAYQDRILLLEEGLNIVKNHPVLGIGPGGFKLLEIGLYGPEASSHNIFLEVALESGIISSIIFSSIIFIPIIKAFTIIFKKELLIYGCDMRPWIICLLGFYLFLTGHTTWEWGYGASVFIMLGVVVSMLEKNLKQNKREININS